ncbi:hypothetical protein GUJ93_ZPchr0007g3170 [Zizania palustris]|uniref:Septum-promoting GTP-binding protein 1 n=1 Tax=Zizania palustris TaxID=103762 RepID=A0A8J5VPU4_ZIZPA|nr:hypothetical protein GUJ93_ZPchr0007g3170 [Zizania palustris]
MTTTTTAAMNATKAVTQFCAPRGDGGGCRRRSRPAVLRLDLRWGRLLRLVVVSRVVRLVWEQLLACSSCGGGAGGGGYRKLGPPQGASVVGGAVLSPLPSDDDYCDRGGAVDPDAADVDDVVSLKVSLLGDCQIGKTSFVVKYVGDEEEQNGLQMTGLNLMDKTLAVQGARIAFSIWDVAAHQPILKPGYPPHPQKMRESSVQRPDTHERTTSAQEDSGLARAYARAMKATLFFSSATHNINVNKIFKFITAKLFNLPWTVERNLTVGEPIIDF